MAEKVEIENGFIVSVSDIEANILKQSLNGDYCFTVDVEDNSEPHGKMRLWCSDDLDEKLVERLREKTHIKFSAERDDDGDMIITKLRVLNGQ